MSVVDLSRRTTSDWDRYNENRKSHESIIFIESKNNENESIIQSDTSINLTIGDIWYKSERHSDIVITERGIKLKPKKYIVFSTEQYFAIPHNVYGMVLGKGVNIYNGAVISTGKITPGFRGKLRIGYYNASDSTIILHKGDLLGCCVFFNMELTIPNELREDSQENAPALEEKRQSLEFFKNNWYKILSVIASIIATAATILK